MQKYVDRKSVSQHEIFASGPLHRVQTHTANTQHTHLSNKMHIYVAFVARTISMLHFALSRVARCACAMLRADPFLASQRPRHTVFRADAFCHRVCCRQRPRVHIELRSNHRMYIIWKWLGSCIGGASRILATKYILIYCVASPTWRRFSWSVKTYVLCFWCGDPYTSEHICCEYHAYTYDTPPNRAHMLLGLRGALWKYCKTQYMQLGRGVRWVGGNTCICILAEDKKKRALTGRICALAVMF